MLSGIGCSKALLERLNGRGSKKNNVRISGSGYSCPAARLARDLQRRIVCEGDQGSTIVLIDAWWERARKVALWFCARHFIQPTERQTESSVKSKE